MHLNRVVLCVVFSLIVPLSDAFAEEESQELPSGIEWIAFPTFKGNSDAGFQYGAVLQLIQFGDQVEPFEWDFRVKLQHSTKGRHEHRVGIWMPHLFKNVAGSAVAEFLHIEDANYFGIGNNTVRGEEKFNQFRLTEPRIRTTLVHRLPFDFYAGGGLNFSLSRTRSAPTQLLAMERPRGFNKNRDLVLLLNVGIDSVNRTFWPTEGVRMEVYSKTSIPGASRYLWSGMGFDARGYLELTSWLSVGQRVMVEALVGDVPFLQMGRIGGSDSFAGLGGVFSQRGYTENRFIGKTKTLFNSEIRALSPPIWFDIQVGGGFFFDASRVVAPSDDIPFWRGVHPSAGAELVFSWRQAFMFRIDVARGNEDGEFYIEGHYMF